MKRDTGQRETEGRQVKELRQGRKRGREKREERMEGEKERKGIIQLFEETDRLKTFRGGICRGDPKISSPLKRILGGFRGVVLTINCKTPQRLTI